MSWRKVGGIDYSKYSNNIHSNVSNFTNIETLKINSNNTSLHVGSNILRLGNNTGETEQVNALWFGGLDLEDSYSFNIEQLPRTSMEEKYFRSEYLKNFIDDSTELTKKELFIYKGGEDFDRIRLKSSTIIFDTYDENFNINFPEDRYEESIRMIINNNGNIGINNTDPRTKLDIYGQLLAGYGSGVMGNGIVNKNTGGYSNLIMNGYYFCGKLGVAYDYSTSESSQNNSKLKIEIFGGELNGSTGIGIDTYVICNNTIVNDIDNEGSLHSVIFKSSICGGVGLSSSGDLYKLCIYRCSDGTDDVYIYVNGEGATLSIRGFLISNSNFSMEMMQEQEILLKYQSSDNSITPGNDATTPRTAVYGPEADINYQQSIKDLNELEKSKVSASNYVKYILKVGFVERYDGKFGVGSDLFSSNMDYGSITGPVDINLNGSTYIKGNLRVDDHTYIENDVTINGRLFLNGEMTMNSVVMKNYQILEKAYIGGGLRLNSNQQTDYQNRGNITEYMQNYIIFDNTKGLRPTNSYWIMQMDEYIENDNFQYDFLTFGRIYDDFKQYSDICIKPVSITRSNIGMGTTNPQNSLDVSGNVCVGENYVTSCVKVPLDSLVVEKHVGIGSNIFPEELNSNSNLRVSGSCTIGNNYANISSPYPHPNGALIQGSLGVSVLEPESVLDIGGSITFGDGSKQSFASSGLGVKTNGIWSKMGTNSNNVFNINNLDYKVTNNTNSKYVVDCNNSASVIFCGCKKSTVYIPKDDDGTIDELESVGNVTAYYWSGLKWNILSETLIGDINNKNSNNDFVGEEFGTSISVDSNGHRLLVGSPSSCNNGIDYCGKITVYNWKNKRWNKIYTFYGEDANSFIGNKCKLSKNGKHMVVSGKNINYIYYIYQSKEDGNFYHSKIYELKSEKNSSNIYEKESTTNNFGCSVDITREGGTIIVGSCDSTFNDIQCGCAYVYLKQLNTEKHILEFNENYYIKINSPDPHEGQKFGSDVSINSLGFTAVVGGPNYRTDDNNDLGFVAIYTVIDNYFNSELRMNSNNSNLINITGSITGDIAGERFGSSVKLNGSGQYLTIGSLGNTNINGSISTYYYEDTSDWLRFTQKYTEKSFDLPAGSLAVSSDSTILVYGYDNKYTNKDYNCMEVVRIGSFENNFSSHIIDAQIAIGISKDNEPEYPLDIYNEKTNNLIRLTSNFHPSSLNDENVEIVDMNSYEGGILFENMIGGKSTYYLKNNDTIITNNTGLLKFNYKDGFKICKIDDEICTFFAKNEFVGINTNNPESHLDISGYQKIRDKNANILISTNKIKPDIPLKYEHNITLGQSPFYLLKTGYKNIGIGYHCAYHVESGYNNIAIGNEAMYEFNCDNGNIAIGNNSLRKCTRKLNTAIGDMSLKEDTHGIGNTAIGANTDVDKNGNWEYSTAIGYNAKIGKSNAIILGDSLDENLCVGIGINAPKKKLEVNGDGIFSGTLNIENILYPDYGINVKDRFIVDVEANLTTITDNLKVDKDTVLETLVVNGICNPNSGININDGDCIIGLEGYSTFGKKDNASNKNNPLLNINGYVQINNDIDIAGVISAQTVQTNSLIFIDLFKPNGGIAMFATNNSDHLIFEVKKDSANTILLDFYRWTNYVHSMMA